MSEEPPPPVAGAGAPLHRADWYPDPTRRFEFRYHNGQAWTGDVSVDGNRFLDPLPNPTFGTFPVRYPTPAGQHLFVPLYDQQGSAGSSMAKPMTAFVLGICSILVGWVPFLCLLAAAGAIVAIVLGIGVLRRDRRQRSEGAENHRGHGYALAGVILAPFGLALSGVGVWLSVVTLREVRDFTDVGRFSTTEDSCRVADGEARSTGTITNESSSTHSYVLTVDFRRSDTSSRIAAGTEEVDDVAPGETVKWTVTRSVSASDVDCRLRTVTGPLPFGQS